MPKPLVERLAANAQCTRHWTGNDQSARHHHGVVRLQEDPLDLSLAWRRSADEPGTPVACLRLHLSALLANDLTRREGRGAVRVRFVRGDGNRIYLQRRGDAPKLAVGRFDP